MLADKLLEKLELGDYVLGCFEIPERGSESVSGSLSWDPEAGVELRLLSDGSASDFVGDNFDVAGLLESGDRIFIPRALTTKSSFSPVSQETLVGGRMILGASENATEGWTRVGVETHNLHEWWPETGIEHDHQPESEDSDVEVSVCWRPPKSRIVKVPWGTVHFAITMPQRYAYSPDWHMETKLRVSASFESPRSISEIDREFVFPIVSFSAFATDFPDAPRKFTLYRENEFASVHDRRETFVQRDWRPGREMLFAEADLAQFESVIARWFELSSQFRPVITSLLDATNQGNVYSVPRFLGLVAALEAFHRIKHGTKAKLLPRLKDLRCELSLDEKGWCNDRNLELIVASRNYYSHLEGPRNGFTDAEVDDGVFSSTRRSLALLQAALLSELGFSNESLHARLSAHYKNWPLPD